jgi:hypothetical protein
MHEVIRGRAFGTGHTGDKERDSRHNGGQIPPACHLGRSRRGAAYVQMTPGRNNKGIDMHGHHARRQVMGGVRKYREKKADGKQPGRQNLHGTSVVG